MSSRTVTTIASFHIPSGLPTLGQGPRSALVACSGRRRNSNCFPRSAFDIATLCPNQTAQNLRKLSKLETFGNLEAPSTKRRPRQHIEMFGSEAWTHPACCGKGRSSSIRAKHGRARPFPRRPPLPPRLVLFGIFRSEGQMGGSRVRVHGAFFCLGFSSASRLCLQFVASLKSALCCCNVRALSK